MSLSRDCHRDLNSTTLSRYPVYRIHSCRRSNDIKYIGIKLYPKHLFSVSVNNSLTLYSRQVPIMTNNSTTCGNGNWRKLLAKVWQKSECETIALFLSQPMERLGNFCRTCARTHPSAQRSHQSSCLFQMNYIFPLSRQYSLAKQTPGNKKHRVKFTVREKEKSGNNSGKSISISSLTLGTFLLNNFWRK